MLIVLPPSEGKAESGDGPPVDVAGLGFPALTPARIRVLDALTAVCERPDAQAVLGLPAGRVADIARNRALRTAATLPAARLYTGVLYDNLGLATLDAAALARAERRLVVFSGLWGLLRPQDRVPPYRLSMGVRLPPVGNLAAFWRPAIGEILDETPGLVVDMRSTTYAAAWRPGARAVSVRVVRDGKVVSHMAKATRGALARSLLLSDAEPETPEKLARHLADLGYRVELGPRPRRGESWTLTCQATV
ncbi:hypothetical protein HNP84_004934 [Thermocatellispora tengchongensis]|uniref:Peroxide stress protein YaaA n=1 Tax=Thermocatellispora tengchongensis TaxID=1073253 RepID=A0A840P6A1_9ACTN|nr:peroxide stress protein YaaA [Thermocatellispora tengchongensis]MBB5135198.1 hypothetical protein [Thermocatellispora tengchongensis]